MDHERTQLFTYRFYAEQYLTNDSFLIDAFNVLMVFLRSP